MKKYCVACLIFCSILLAACSGSESDAPKLNANLDINITYTGSGTVNASNKIYAIVIKEQCNRLQPPLYVGSIESASGTITAPRLNSSTVYVTVFFDINGSVADCALPSTPTVLHSCASPFFLTDALGNGDPFTVYNGGVFSATNAPIPDPITLTANETKSISVTFTDAGYNYDALKPGCK
jgi:hypothetical protein